MAPGRWSLTINFKALGGISVFSPFAPCEGPLLYSILKMTNIPLEPFLPSVTKHHEGNSHWIKNATAYCTTCELHACGGPWLYLWETLLCFRDFHFLIFNFITFVGKIMTPNFGSKCPVSKGMWGPQAGAGSANTSQSPCLGPLSTASKSG